MIEHSHIEFRKILSFGKVEDEIVKQVKMVPNYEQLVRSNKANSTIRQILRSFIDKFDIQVTAVEVLSQMGVL